MIGATRGYEEVAVGERLPELVVPVTRTLIVAGAIASRDFQDVHHDPELARRRGSKDIFMNILTTNGLVGRYVTEWSGPGGILRRINIRLGAPNYPGDVMTLTGTVAAKHGPDRELGPGGRRGVVEVAVRGANGPGDHVIGTVMVALPMAGRDGSGGVDGGAGRDGSGGVGEGKG